MKLYCHPISPYARKVMILARLHEIPMEELTPTANGAQGYTDGLNPLGKIPALVLADNRVLFDSRVIYDYLDSLAETPLLPADTEMRLDQHCLHALGDGLSDAVYNYRYEIVRDPALHWDTMIARHTRAMQDGIDHLEAVSPTLGEPWTYGNLSIICALDYMDYRAPHIEWQSRAPKLAAWFETFTNDRAYQDTDGFPKVST